MPRYGEPVMPTTTSLGFSFLNLKHHAIQFHLDHERANREEETAISRKMFERKKREGVSFCKKGLD